MPRADAPETHRHAPHSSPRAHSPTDVRDPEGPRVTAARGAAFGALVLAVAVVAVLLLRGDGGTTYKLLFQNAGQLVKDDDVQIGGRRIGSVRKIKLTDNNQAEITITVEEPYAPLHEGTHGDDPRDLAVGHRQPLHRADARARTPAASCSTTARRSATDTTTDDRRPRPALQHARPEDAQGPAGRHPGLRDAVVRQPRRRGQRGRRSTSTRCCSSASRRLVNELDRRRGRRSTRFLDQRRPRRPARSPSAATTSPTSSPTPTRPPAAIAGENASLDAGAGAAARPRCAAPTRRS